jgi:hypothetical protein
MNPKEPQMHEEQLPPLPGLPIHASTGALGLMYTADQMREYGRQCASLAAERVPEPAAPATTCGTCEGRGYVVTSSRGEDVQEPCGACNHPEPAALPAEVEPWALKMALEKSSSIIMQLEVAAERFTRYSHDTIDGLLQEAADALRALSVAPQGDEITCPHCREAIAVRYPECWVATPIAAAEPSDDWFKSEVIHAGNAGYAQGLIDGKALALRDCVMAAQAAAPAQAAAVPEIEAYRKALHYVAFALHGTPQHMLAKGITLHDNDRVSVKIAGIDVDTGRVADPFAPFDAAKAAAVPEAVERDALIDVARTALEAYENRFESVYGRYNGPIDDEMKALKTAIDRLAALSQGDVSGEGEGS